MSATLTLLGKTYAAWLKQCAPVFRAVTEAVNEIARWLTPYLQALDEMARSPEIQRMVQGLAGLQQWMDSAPGYCAPYDREIVRLGLEPLTQEEQRHSMIVAVFLQSGGRVRLGHRPPLEQVALLAGRLDVTAAIVMEREATQSAIRRMEMSNEQGEGELVTTAYLELRQSILPSIQRRLNRVPMTEFRRVVRPALAQVVRDDYLVKSIRRALVRRLDREAQRKGKEEDWEHEADRSHSARHHGEDQELNWDIERALASFLGRPRASALDRKLVAALRRWPDSSAREIALRIGEPVRTVQYHYRKLVDYVRKQLES